MRVVSRWARIDFPPLGGRVEAGYEYNACIAFSFSIASGNADAIAIDQLSKREQR
jgi:hypothetical protein